MHSCDLDRRATRYIKKLANKGVIGADQMLAKVKQNQEAEHERLRLAVVEAAKAWRRAIDVRDAEFDLIGAIDALKEFESKVCRVEAK